MTAQQYLSQARRLNAFIESDKRELERLWSQATGLSGADFSERVQGTPTDTGIDGIIEKITELKNKINAELERCIALKNEIWDTINAVSNDDERLVLRLRYIEFMKFEKISVQMNYTERRVKQIHRQALNKIEIPQTFH
ncbi:MAG: DUF1492 domain-containing protein [Clostridia bacterium]|nr:DUF1492 domain-containing protein [Clostridia bacterium]